MARVKTGWFLPQYTDDYGNVYTNQFFKFSNGLPNAVLEALGFQQGTPPACAGSVPFNHRYLDVTWVNGRSTRIVVPARQGDTGIVARLNAIRALQITGYALQCADLVGEKWTLVTPRAYPEGVTPAFRTAPYNDISDVVNRESVRYSYNSDIIPGVTQLGTSIEREPTTLNTCQKGCLTDVSSGQGICSAQATGIKPRFYTVQALGINPADVGNPNAPTFRVARQAKVSAVASAGIRACITAIAGCSYCLSYQGESATSIHNLV